MRGEQEEIADVLVVFHGEFILYFSHGAKDDADLVIAKDFFGCKEANGAGHGGHLSSTAKAVSNFGGHCPPQAGVSPVPPLP
jgi:hypothetical protein